MGVSITVGEVRASYANVWRAKEYDDGGLKFSLCVLVPKTNTAMVKRINEAIEKAFLEGVEKGFWKKAFRKSPQLKTPLRDGDAEVESGQKKEGIGYEGMFFFNANAEGDPTHDNYSPPEITKPLNGNVVPITDQSEFYSGCWGHVAVSFYPFSNRSKGVAVGLSAIFKTRDGDRLDGRVSAKSAFSEFAEQMGDLENEEEYVLGVDMGDDLGDDLGDDGDDL